MGTSTVNAAAADAFDFIADAQVHAGTQRFAQGHAALSGIEGHGDQCDSAGFPAPGLGESEFSWTKRASTKQTCLEAEGVSKLGAFPGKL